MSFRGLLNDCQARDIKLAVKNGKLLLSDEKGNLTAELKQALTLHKAAIITWLQGGDSEAIPRREDLAQYPLSFPQQRLWFIDQLGGSTQYNVPSAFALNGRLDLAALQQSLDAIVARHAVLRTVFRLEDGEPVQCIRPFEPVAVQQLDLSDCSAEEQRHRVRELLAAERNTPFDLGQDLMLRCRLLRLGEDAHVVLFTLHHIASDGWSLGVLIKEFVEGYSAFGEGRAVSLPPLAIQYADYAQWQREAMRGGLVEAELNFWKEALEGIPSVHRLPLDKPRPPQQRFEAQRYGLRLDSATTAALQQLARAHNATLFMLLQSAFAALLHRFSGESDIVMGVPHAGRAQKELAPLIGFFVNTLVFRSRFDGDLRVSELLAQGRQLALDSFAHCHVPFDLLGDALRHERSLAYNPLCQIKFVLQNFEAGELKLPGLQLAPVEQGGGGHVHFDLDLTAVESDDGLQLGFTYKDELFQRPTIERLAQTYRRLLLQMIARPQARLSELDWLGEDDGELLRAQGRGPASTTYRELPLPRQIEQQAQRTPDAIAVRCGDRSLSYAQLDARANRLAQALIEQGVTPRDRVGVHLERSIELMIALLAVMKSGAAYVMLDHKQTPERLQAILGDAGIGLVLLDSRRSVLPVAGVDTLFLDDAVVDADWLAEYPATSPAVAIAEEDSAYVLYTSGSTGTPKGVEILHRGLTDYCAFAREGYYAESLTGSLVVTSPAFDLTVPSLYVPLLTGGCVELILAEEDLAGLVTRLERSDAQPVLLRLTPSHLQALLQLADETPRTTAHVFVIGGEAFGVDLARELQAKYPSAQIYNHYGPTETVVGCCWYDVTANLATLDRTIPIGRPMSNTQLYVLDAQGKLQPPGVAGELYIGGAGVAKGYLNQPELTAAKFVVDPFNSNERIYRSGDRVRWRSDGQLEFLGRLDDQVKLRGFRIELGDIESALRRHGNVRDAVAVVKGEGSEARLVAYVVISEADGIDAIRTAVAEQLPSYMQPSAYVELDQLPLTPNGKVDRNALPEPERQAQVFVEPQGETETTLAAIWARVLKLEAISRDANFFELGGHSLLATRVVSEIGRTFGKPVPVRALFEHPQLAQLAAHVDAQARSGYTPIPAVARDAALPLSFAQQRLWFIDRLEGGSAQYNMPVALRLSGELNLDALQQSLDALVARHEVLRTSYAEIDGKAQQRIAAATAVTIAQHDLRRLAAPAREARLQQLAHEHATQDFDLARGLMLRCALVQLDEGEHALLFAMHHIASDGWSLGVLVREFVALYGALAEGKPVQLLPLPVQYADYAAWQRERLQGATLRAHLDYWRRQLAELPVVHGLPLDKPRPPQQRFAGARVQQDIDAATLAGLNALARAHDASLFMLLQAAFAVLVSRWSGETDIVIGTPVAGRLHPDVEPLIGFFVNTLVLRSDLSANPRFVDLLAQARATALAGYEHQEIPFETLVDELKPARSLAHAPLFQLMFTLQNNEQSSLTLPGLSVAPLASREVPAKFDLELAASESTQGLRLSWNYAQSLFEAATMQRLGESFGRLLRGIVEDAQRPVLQLPLLSPGERRQVLHEFNDTAVDYGADALIHELFEQQAQRTPDAIALRFEGEALSYAELDARANRLAHHLIALGVAPEDRVAVCLQRSLELVVALLGVLKAGAAYVPLDPDYPAERLAYLLADAAPVAVLTQSAVSAGVPLLQGSALPLLWLDRETFADQPAHKPHVAGITPRNLAYVIYTSGSTGQPKGVMNEHRGVVNRLRWGQAQFAFGAGDRVLQKTPYSFDVSVWEFFMPLLAGATLVVAKPQGHQDPAYLIDLIVREAVTVAHFVPSMLQVFIDQEQAARCTSLRLVKCSGEALAYSAQQRFAQLLPDAALFNLYGPTEAAVEVSWWRCDGSLHAGIVPIGRPVANTQLYVLDAQRQPLPVGVAGELYIGGVQVARGYINRSELTAERFVADPFSALPEARLYRTGDLVRWLADGSLEYLGRNDFQVKIRGFRIELGEIEAKLSACAGVNEAAVVVREDVPGEKRLVAYLVASAQDGLVEQLRAELAAQLPAYMMPAAFVLLPAMPLNSNGKLDRRQLPAPDYLAQQDYVAPTGTVEARLAEIWQQLLRVERVGVHDNFFQMGGDSILSIQVVARANQAGIHITTRQLFEAQTIAELARLAATEATTLAPQEAVGGLLPLLPIQRRFLQGDARERHHYNQAVLLQTPAGFDAATLDLLIAAIYARHDALRLRFSEGSDGWQAEHRPLDTAMIADSCAVETLPADAAAQSGFITARCSEWQTRFDLADGPLLRAVLFLPQDPASAGRLLLAVHHVVMDGVSWRVLLADLEQAYAQHRNGETVQLRAKTSSLQQWGQALARHAASEALQQERAYWLAQNQPPVAPLPLDRDTDGEGSLASTRSVTLALDADTTKALLQQCPAAYRTQVNELLLAGIYLGMREWSGSDGLRLRLEGHGREALFDELDITQTIGWFTSVFPLTLRCDQADAGAVIRAVKEQYRAIPHHGIGYGLLRYLADDAQALAACDDDAVLEFNYLGQFDQVLNAESRFQAGRESIGAQVSPQRRRSSRLGLVGKVYGGQLQFALSYSEEQYDESTVRRIAALLESGLRRVVEHCCQPGAGAYTLSDFPLARIGAAQLDAWQARYPALARLYPATPMQAGLHFESLVEASTYVVQMMPVLQGELDLAAFRAAWQQTVLRHDALRTAFVGEGEGLHQLVWAQAELPWHEQDWRGLDDVEQSRRFEAYRLRDKQVAFDFTAPPLMRLAVFRLGEQRYQLLWTYHHILTDGWSSPLIYRDVVALYHAQLQGRPAALAPAPSYERYIAWLQRQDPAQARAHWRGLLGRLEAPTPLVLDSLPGDGGRGPREQRLLLGVAETDALRALAQVQHTTVNTLLQWCWAYLLHRYSGETQVVFGATISGRAAAVPEIEQMVGLFINTIPVTVAFGPGRDIAGSLRTLQQDFQRSNDFGFLSLVEIQAQSPLRSGVALFDSLLVFENYPLDAMAEAADAAGASDTSQHLRVERSSSNEQTNFAITLNASLERSLQVKCAYRAERFAEATIARLLSHLGAVLRQLPAALREGRRIDLLAAAERQQLQAWNATQRDYACNDTIHAQFEAQARLHPQATAVVHGDTRLSYAELDRRANRLAHKLQALGAQRDGRIAICLERGVDMVIALLASLKAGSAYVPLDPRYPAERLAYMLEDAAPTVVLSQSSLRDSLPALAATQQPVLLLDAEDLSALPDSAPTVAGQQATDLAYVIYTSGSTGQPKGVEQTHRTLVNLMASLFRRYPLLAQPLPTLQFATLNFDMSLYEVCNALFSGSALVLIGEDDRLDLSRLFALIEREQVGRVYLPTAMLQPFAHAALAQELRLPALKLVQVAGEQLTITPTIRDWAQRSGCPLLNLYGPTESHVASDYLLEGDAMNWPTLPPVGKPVDNLQLLVLDAQLQPVPIGVAGELYLAGDGLARGYLQRPALTAERFVEIAQDGAVLPLYKTGDLARWLPDGNLDYLGRNDFQVKIHGFRIELGEIEARLTACAAVRDAAVVALADGATGRRLVAYVVMDEGVEAEPAQLRAELARELPDYMLPAAFVVLPALPLTANGKVDRRALPAPDAAALAERAYAAPEGEIEIAIVEVWKDLLGLEQVGRDDHFFELGGHSLRVISLIERLRQRGYRLGVKAVFAAPTVRALAEVIARGDEEQAEVAPNRITADTARITPELLPLVDLGQAAIDTIVAAVPGGVANIQDIYPLGPLQEGILFHYLLGGSGDAYLLRRVVGFDSRERLDAFLAALQQVIDRHDILRSAVFWQGLPKPVQVVHRRAPLPLHELVLDAAAPALPQLLAQTDPRRTRLDLQRAPVIAAYAALDAHSGEWLLALLNHHMVCDHVTLDLMIGEIHRLLQGQGDSLATPLPYRNFIARTQTVSEAVHEAYFRHELGGIDTPVAPFGVLDVRNDAQGVSEKRLALSDALAQRIREQARLCGVTPAVLFHVGWAQVLGRCTGLDDVVFGTVLSGRLQGSEGADQVVGLFINTLPLRIPLAGLGVRAAVDETYRRLGELLTHEQASLALAQRCSAVPAGLPLFTALLNYRHIHKIGAPADTAWQGMRSLDASSRNSYPLTLSVEDRGQAFGLTALCAQGIDGERITRYLEGVMTQLVEKLESDPACPLQQLALLPEAEQQQLLAWSRGQPSTQWRELALPQQFEQQAQRTPQATALRCGETALTFAELNTRANRLAHALIEQGLGRGARVGVHLERSPELLIALLAVLKTGAAYVMLDQRQTTARLGAIIADAGIELALLDSRRSLLPVGGLDTFYLDDAGSAADWLAEYPATDPGIAVAPEDSAYVLYTSGSTGTPKGVEILHRGLTDYCAFAREGYYADALTGSLVVTSPAFDLTVPSLYVPLLSGGCVELISAEEDLAGLVARLERSDAQPVLLRLTPSHLQALLQLADSQPRQAVHVFVIGGEAFGVDLARELQAKYPSAQIYNHYGPTETVVGCCWYDVTANLATLDRTIPIGRPMSNTALYVLDAQGRLQPPGVAGELYIGGAGVAKGYLNQPGLTAAKFVADPFDASERVYRSGDRVRWRSDGQLEFLGRLDDQVKLRGFRIELGEIEAVLRRHAAVRDAIVLLRGEGSEARLIAYVVADAVAGLDNSLKVQLAEQLPSYMQPAAYVVLPRLPLTANGKVDKANLPQPEQTQRERIAPRTPVEQELATLWAGLLGLDAARISVSDSFFELGGHSILAIRLVVQLSERFPLALGVRDLFRHPTLQELAAHIGNAGGGEEEWNPLVLLQREATGPSLYCVPAAGLTAASYQPLARALGQRLALQVFEPRGYSAAQSPAASMDEIVAANLAALRTHQPQGPYYLAGHSFGGGVAFEMARALEQQGEAVQLLLLDSLLYLSEELRQDRSGSSQLRQLLGEEAAGEADDVQLRDLLQQRLRQLGLLSSLDNSTVLDNYIKAFDAQVKLYADYRPSGPLQGRVVPLLAQGGLARRDNGELMQHYRHCCTAMEPAAIVAGSHLSMLSPEHVESLAAALLERTQAVRLQVAV